MKLPTSGLLLIAFAVAGCAGRGGELDESGGVTAVRSVCPQVAVAAGTGDVTLFDPGLGAGQPRTAAAVDVVAAMTNVRGACNDAAGDQVATTVSFTVEATRTRTDAARDVVLPYYVAVVRGGTQVSAKRIGGVQLHFDAGKARAQVDGQATTQITRAAATLPQNVRAELTKRRKAGDQDAAVDPLSKPEIRKAVASATFEALVGFQLTDDQLRYNATR